MEQYTASNGVIVDVWQDCVGYGMTRLDYGSTVALREFFRAEEDERLGRWRWPDEPRFVVYPWANPGDANPRIAIVDEGTGGQFTTTRATVSGTDTWAKVARAYFDAHPEPKPWRNAESGEVWVLRFENDDEEFAAVRIDGRWKATEGGWPNEDLITDGRRIWPEDAS